MNEKLERDGGGGQRLANCDTLRHFWRSLNSDERKSHFAYDFESLIMQKVLRARSITYLIWVDSTIVGRRQRQRQRQRQCQWKGWQENQFFFHVKGRAYPMKISIFATFCPLLFNKTV